MFGLMLKKTADAEKASLHEEIAELVSSNGHLRRQLERQCEAASDVIGKQNDEIAALDAQIATLESAAKRPGQIKRVAQPQPYPQPAKKRPTKAAKKGK